MPVVLVGMAVGDAWSRVSWDWFTASAGHGVGVLTVSGTDAAKRTFIPKTRLNC